DYRFLCYLVLFLFFFFFSSRRRHTRFDCDWSSDVCSSDLNRHTLPASWPAFLVPAIHASLYGGRERRGWPGLGPAMTTESFEMRSEERRVGKECRCRWEADH